MPELERRYGGDLFRGPGARDFSGHIRDAYRQGAIADAQLDCLFGITDKAIKQTVGLEVERRKLVADDPVFIGVTAPYMTAFVQQAQRIQGGLYGGGFMAFR